MAPHPYKLQALAYEDESTFGAFSTSFANRLLYTGGPIDVAGLTHEKVPIDPVIQRQNDGVLDMRGIMGGQFVIEFDLVGRGSSSGGAVTLSDFATFLGRLLGNSAVAATSGTTLIGGSDADTLNLTAAAADFSAGSLLRVGALGDTRCEGQFAAVDSDAADVVELLTELPGSGAAADAVYAPDMVYPNEDPDQSAVTSLRFKFLSANQIFECFGCWCSAIEFTGLNTGGRPKGRATITVSHWRNTSGTFPSTLTPVNLASPRPVAAGSFFYNTVGTTTRLTEAIRSFDLRMDLQTHPLLGPGGVSQFQSVVGVVRSGVRASFDFLVDGDDTDWDGWWNTDENSDVFRHILYTLSAVDGGAVGFYFPKVKPVQMRPMQSDNEGVNARKVSCEAVTGPTTTNQLTLSSWRIGLA